MDILGVDIGTVSVKYVRLRGRGRKGSMVSKGIHPYNGELPHLELILRSIRAKEGNLRTAVGLSSQDILKKAVSIPVMPKEEVKEALNWSISKTISSQLDEMFFDYAMLGPVEERGVKKEEACFVGAQKVFVNNLLAAFRNSGFKDVILLTDTGFTYQELMGNESQGSAAVVDVGGTQTGIYVFEGKKMRLVREILIAAESFSDALLSGIDLRSKERASDIETAFRDGRVMLSDVSFEKFAGEVQRTLNVFDKRYPAKPVKKIFITGRGSSIPAFMEKLKGYFGETVELLNPVKDLEPEYVPAYLLSAYPDRLVNLLPEDVKAKEQEAVYRRWLTIGSLGVAAVLLVLSLQMITKFHRMDIDLQVETTRVARMKEQVQLLSTADASGKYGDLLPFMKEIEKKDETFIVLLKYLSSRMPKEIYLKAMRFGFDRSTVVPLPEAPQKEGQALDSGLRDLVRMGSRPSLPKTEGGQPAPAPAETRRWLTISGVAVGEVDAADPALLDLVIKLGGSGIVDNVEVTGKRIRVLNGKRVIEFTITGRCAPYEI